MKVICGLNQIKKFNKSVVALGVFDGVHLAHRRILKETVRIARRINATSIAMTFWPHPQGKGSLYSLEHRLRLISQLGIDVCIVVKFNKAFSRIAPEEFIKQILVKKLRAYYIFVGRNFRFGKAARGDCRTLNRLSCLYNFKVKVFKVIKINHRPVSSTYIRRLITKGNLNKAKKLLCQPVSILGTVIRGASLGKRLGFPTANINPHHEVLPPSGVYVVNIIFGNKRLNGLCYIGTKPTFRTQGLQRAAYNSKNIEVHIFNFKKNIYSRYLEIRFIKKLRNEKRFSSRDALIKQIKKDTRKSQSFFSLH
jgi:riboflavin kinase/FMN adenylyltransferase